MVPESIDTPPMEGHWKFLGGGGSKKPNFSKKSMKLNRNFLGGGGGRSEGMQNKKPVGGVWIFSGTTQFLVHKQVNTSER